MLAWGVLIGVLCVTAAAAYFAFVRPRGYQRWVGTYVRQTPKRQLPRPDDDMHVLLCVADHYEPKAQKVDKARGQSRVDFWVREYPRQFERFRDSDGHSPRHSFFFPIEEYEPEYLDTLAGLCHRGFGEVEIHLHHEKDTAANLNTNILAFKETLAGRHGLLSKKRATAEIGYAFIHGNWALCNSRPDGRCCGVNNELEILRESGCFADFTFPSAPSPTQPPTINSIYYAVDHPGRPRSADRGFAIGSGSVPESGLLLIQGPLLLDWRSRKWGLAPRLENGCLQSSQPPSLARLDSWLCAARASSQSA